MELEVLSDERSHIEEVVPVAFSELVIHLHSCLVRGSQEVLGLEVILQELVIGALVNKDRGRLSGTSHEVSRVVGLASLH